MIHRQRYFARDGGLVHWAVMHWLIVINWNDVRWVQPID
jgi:hypothetical protein